ncbi:UvrD-helicase domain-containing protein [Anaerococcus degeneri]|uniref:DNA 3'-5' helicase n=1 Tax=Anaerococcus degeneri TaxID=361500 RepID=A0ABS7Z2D3_9FIRM|nr:UvrD-helicase domain-containing protein [Anaerococcus degeneri]MBP2014730.1 ATP-dependent helicase/nuclease subunit A [Anaerococcus degeneri]MCA2096941.1 UvrD-helicase domain-containing protein [Anaerococcus degeneri]
MTELKLTDGQRTAIYERNKNIIVSAAAGSGKTMVLVNRVISMMVEEGIDIDKMIIVTFTNKSAQDMKDKIREALEKRADDFDLAFIKRQFKLLKLAQIKTLHSFCSDMLRENFYYLENLSPNFKVMPDSTGKIYMADAIDEVFDKEYEKMDDDFVYFLQNFSGERSDYNAKQIILLTYQKIVGMIDGMAWLEVAKDKGENLEYFKDFIKNKFDLILKTIENLGARLNPDLSASAVNLIASDYEMLAFIRNQIDNWDDFPKALASKKYVTFAKKIKTEIGDDDLVNEINAARDSYKAAVKDLEAMITNTDSMALDFINAKEEVLFREIYKLTKDFKETFDSKKRAKDYLDFNDLEHEFIRLLDNETAREKLKTKYKYIFFDEYQDSNEIQNYIVDKLKSERNLFFVGDVKQSIYGFRRARPDLFIEKLDSYEKNEDSMRINLNENFRTDRLILDFNNYIFDRLMTKDMADIDYKKGGHRLNYGKEEKDLLDSARVGMKVLGPDVKEEIYLTSLIKDLIAEGYEYRDIAILLRNGTESYKYEEAFKKADIPYFNDISKVSTQASEVGFFINLLKYLTNPNDDLVLLAILRSVIFDIDENDLAKIKLASDSYKFYEAFNAYDKDDEVGEKIKSFKALIEDLKDKLVILNLYDFANYLFEKSGLYDFLLARDLACDRINNIESVIELMADYDAANDNGLYGFVSFFNNLESTRSDSISPTRDLSEGEDLVRIMTVHKSKGLEFKIVILAGADKGFNNKTNPIIFDEKIGIGINVADYDKKIKIPSINRKLIIEKSREDDKKEEMRILYVALTRAEERLYITGNFAKTDKAMDKVYKNESYLSLNSHLEWLLTALSFDGITSEFFTGTQKESAFDKRISFDFIEEVADLKANRDENLFDLLNEKADKELFSKIKDYLEFAYAGKDDIGKSLKKSVTELAKDFNKENEGYESFDAEGFSRNISFKKPSFMEEEKTYSPTEKGSLIHKVFQKLPMKAYTEKDLEDELDKLIEKKIFDENIKEIIDLDKLMSFYQSDLIRKLIAENIPKRSEESFLMAYDGYYVNGQIDLIFEGEDEIILIDFKTDTIKREEAYKPQLAIYKEAIEEALGKKVGKSLIYWYNFKEFQEM